MRRSVKPAVVFVLVAGLLALAAPAQAHNHRIFYEPRNQDVKAQPIKKIAKTLPSAIAATALFANPVQGQAQIQAAKTTLTRNPDTALLLEPGFETPADVCGPPSCSEVKITVPAGAGPRTLYARAAWNLPSYYVHIWGISPVVDSDSQSGNEVDCSYIGQPGLLALQNCGYQVVQGRANISDSFDKEAGNERTIPVSEFNVANPAPGEWRIQTRAVFGYKIPVSTTVSLAAGPPVAYKRLGVRELADKYLTQKTSVNIVFAGRKWTKEEIAAFRNLMPDHYRPGVLSKQSDDCAGSNDGEANALLNWQVCHYSGTESPDATGYKPYFEPIRFNYNYSFLQADDTWTKDLFAKAKSVTKQDAPFDQTSTVSTYVGVPKVSPGDYLTLYDTLQGRQTRDAAHQVSNTKVSDKIDAFAVEDWIADSRLNAKYGHSFKDIETGEVRSARFINPDPKGYFDPFYARQGLDHVPQGPATSYTFFVLDTYTPEYAAQYFRPNAYHHWDVSMHMIDPDVNAQDGPDWSRVWGGRYRFFFHDIGAGPNPYEAIDFFLGRLPGSAAKPFGDPPIWDYDNDSFWQGKLVERTARDALTMLFYRFTPSYLYRPLPADVYFLASNNWEDCYSNPECSPDGISHTILEKIYRPSYVEKNLASALPGATFTTERAFKTLETYRYLGCAASRAVINNPKLPPVLVPDPNCIGKKSDPIQEAIEIAKARGDDLVGVGVNDFGTSGMIMRSWVEAHRDMIAPLLPGQQTLTNISIVFPGSTTWYLPLITGGVALPTPNDEIWGILNNVNDRFKSTEATDCAKSKPIAPGCGIVPATAGGGFSYTVQHEASHFLGLLHPHDSLLVERDSTGKFEYYGYSYRHYGDHSMAPTTYAGAFTPYSVLDQDIVQRGHAAEYLRMTEDTIADAYLQDGMKGLSGPSALTKKKLAEAERWKNLATQLFTCGDYLQVERAMRNAFLSAQGTFGPIVKARALKAGERVLFEVGGQAAYSAKGASISGCATAAGSSVLGTKTTALGSVKKPPLAATGLADESTVALLLLVSVAAVLRWRRRVA